MPTLKRGRKRVVCVRRRVFAKHEVEFDYKREVQQRKAPHSTKKVEKYMKAQGEINYRTIKGNSILYRLLNKKKGKKSKFEVLVKVISSGIPENILEVLERSAHTFARSLKGKIEDRTGITKSTYHFGCWRLYLSRERKTQRSRDRPGRRFLYSNLQLFKLIDKMFLNNFPNHYKDYVKLNRKHRTNGSITKCFKTCALNLEGFSKFHVDYKDIKEGKVLILPATL